MKILLLLSASRRYREAADRGKPFASYAPTTLIHLAALIPGDVEASATLVDLGIEPLPEITGFDLIGISTTTCGAQEAFNIADQARAMGITVVLGGSHPTALPDEALLHADSVVVGMAESTWPRLLHDFKQHKLKPIYNNDNKQTPFIAPHLDRTLLGKGKYLFTNTIEATKGCPNNCHFCVVKSLVPYCGTRDLSDVVPEIEKMGKQILFLDSNHTGFPGYNSLLWKELKRLNKEWFSTGTFKFASDPARLKIAAESGMKGILIGFESVNQESLTGTGKNFNNAGRFGETIKMIHDHGILIFGSFTYGFDTDDKDIFEKTVEFAIKSRIDIVRYGTLTPLPATTLFAQLEKDGRILTRDWGTYDTENVVFKPRLMEPEQLIEGMQWSYKETYRFSSIIKRLNWAGKTTVLSILGNLGFKQMTKF